MRKIHKTKMSETNEIKAVKLTRTGKRPLAFNGRELFDGTTRTHNSTRWTKCSIFETDAGKVVVGIVGVTCWQGESDFYRAEVFSDRAAAIDYVEENAPALAPAAADELGVSESV